MTTRDELTGPTICFAHAAYQLRDEFLTRGRTTPSFEVRSLADLENRIGEADILVVSGLWRNELLKHATRLRFIQSVSAGTDQFSRDLIRESRVRLASAQGANERAVAEHAIALMLALVRKLHVARDLQAKCQWRGIIANRMQREDELGGKTLLIVGLGRIGSRLARIASAFGMNVIGVKRSSAEMPDVARVVPVDQLVDVLPQADFVVLTCPLTPETEGLIGREELAAMRPDAYLINVARGRVVKEKALIEALKQGSIMGAGLDCFHDEPLSPASPLWSFENVVITPHTAGESRRYETRVIDLLLENLDRLGKNLPLVNEIA